jgi:ribulose-phosphate 3-epimerase
MQTVPSLLEKTSEDLIFQINKLSPYFKRFQIDIADGIFVPNKTVQIEEIKDSLIKDCLNKDSLSFDFHLMVKDYQTEIKKVEELKKIIKINLILIHLSVTTHYSLITSHSSFPIGLTLNPKDQVSDLTYHYPLDTIPSIQIMSVTPGVQGNPFLPETLIKIEQLRVLGYRSNIFLDGAVNDKTLPMINKLKYKPDVLCPGSFLTKAKDLKKNVEYLNKFKIIY